MKRSVRRQWLAVLFLLFLLIAGVVVGLAYNVTIGAAIVIIPLGLLIAWIIQRVQGRGPVE